MNPIGLKFMIEKREGHGEDSNPLFLVKDDFCAVGVFDGMGGSGATTCVSDFGDDHTKAYVASRIIEEAISNYLNNSLNYSDINAEGIWNIAKSRLEQEKSNFPTKASGLRSKLVRDYPTTLAIVTCKSHDDGTSTINSYWAGDSRNYLWNSEGFFQISKDDLDVENDPLENLRNDGALSNCICADRSFKINNKSIDVTGPFVIISATDGCFGYFPTPMHFQEVLLTGLKLSEDREAWEHFVKEEMCKVTGDDISLSLCAIGYEDFNTLKKSFSTDEIAGFNEISSLQDEISNLEISIRGKKARLEESIQEGWGNYKTSYMKYIDPSLEAVSTEISTSGVDEKSGTENKEFVSLTPDSAPAKPENEADIEAIPPTENQERDSIIDSIEPSDNTYTEPTVTDSVDAVVDGDNALCDSYAEYKELPENACEESPATGTEKISDEERKAPEEAASEVLNGIVEDSFRTETIITEEKKSPTEPDTIVEKIEADQVLTIKDKNDESHVTPPKRVGVHAESATPFPKRVGVTSQKSGLRFGDKEPKMSHISTKSFTTVSSESIDDVAQRLLDEFVKNPSREMAIKMLDTFHILPADIKEEIKQYLK